MENINISLYIVKKSQKQYSCLQQQNAKYHLVVIHSIQRLDDRGIIPQNSSNCSLICTIFHLLSAQCAYLFFLMGALVE